MSLFIRRRLREHGRRRLQLERNQNSRPSQFFSCSQHFKMLLFFPPPGERHNNETRFLLTVFVLGDALQRDAKEGGVGVVVPDQQLRPSGDVHARPVEYTRPAGVATQSPHTFMFCH